MAALMLVAFSATFFLILVLFFKHVLPCNFSVLPDIGNIEFSVYDITLLPPTVLKTQVPTEENVMVFKICQGLNLPVKLAPAKVEIIPEVSSPMIFHMCLGLDLPAKLSAPKVEIIPDVSDLLVYHMCLGLDIKARYKPPEH
ncbi:hypothetical protein AVEN_162862-1 [Araneus ventricosus]|uniref:Uncharacterized protein n=1 Tax=Araneus ventricosus TaxID=182803 RepID=A0A4Y2C5Y5_ARAVE|nr:hypothetical protein AVEN_162862-1 [Araneus ventricosus]